MPSPEEVMQSARSIEGIEGLGGAAGEQLRRKSAALYADGTGEMRAGPNPRTISNTVCDDPDSANGSESATLSKLTAMACK